MTAKNRKLLGGINRFRLMLTLGLAVLLPAAALIYVNFNQLRTFERDKVLEAMIHRDFQEVLAISEKKMNKKAYALLEEPREMFPSPDSDPAEKEDKLDRVLDSNPALSHAFLFDERGFIIRTQRSELSDKLVTDERERVAESYRTWFSSEVESKMLLEELNKRPQHALFSNSSTKRVDGPGFLATAIFLLPGVASDRIVLGGITFDPCFMKQTFFPTMLQEVANQKTSEQSGNRVAMVIFRPDSDMHASEIKPMVASAGWDNGNPEVVRKFDDVFRPLAIGIKYQGTSVEAMGETWVHNGFLILGFLSLMIIGGLVLTKHMVSKEVALAKLKADFVSN